MAVRAAVTSVEAVGAVDLRPLPRLSDAEVSSEELAALVYLAPV